MDHDLTSRPPRAAGFTPRVATHGTRRHQCGSVAAAAPPGTAKRIARGVMLGATALAAAGCMPEGFLITPAPASRKLVETTLVRESLLASAKIAVIDVEGILLNAHEPRLIGEGEHAVSLLTEQLDKARGDPAVRAVVLRINSPGGGVTASDLMHGEIERFRKTGRPVYAVMMDVAASGGYYVACACDEIYAQPTTITGSIGVIMQMVDLSGTLGKIGIKTDAITSGARKDAGSPLRSMTPEERELFQGIVNGLYERFVSVVVGGRPKLDEGQVRELADGRVFTAQQALDAGLIDGIAGMRDVIAKAKERVGAGKVRVVAYHRPLGYVANYYGGSPGPPPQAAEINLINLNLGELLQASYPQFLYLWSPGTR